MHVFLSEYLTCGASPEVRDTKRSLAVEGAAMIRALAADAAAVPGWRVVVTWDAALEPFGVPGVEVRLAHSPDKERGLFHRLTAEADATFVIAPEFQRLLEARSRTIAEAGGRSAGSTPEAIALCSDKLALAEHLTRCAIPVIETRLCDFAELDAVLACPSGDGFVVKPRFGAGSVDLFRVRNRSNFAAARDVYAFRQPYGEPLLQPFVPGLPLSIAGIVSPSGAELFPIARQQIIGEHNLAYTGGSLPTATAHDDAVVDLARRVLACVPGLRGYVGIDILLPEAANGLGPPLVIEINPRLTTSYLGYRLLAAENLAERLLAPAPGPPIRWRPGQVEFSCSGTAAFADSPRSILAISGPALRPRA